MKYIIILQPTKGVMVHNQYIYFYTLEHLTNYWSFFDND